MIKTLRPYQQEVLNALKQKLKEVSHPLLVNMSVGAGKSLCIAELLLTMERAGFPVLCLTMNSTLIQQNADTYKLQGGNPDIYCAGLNSKDCKKLIVFGSPHSIIQDIKNQKEISRKPFKLIVVDEAHNISPIDKNSMYQRILNHYGFMAQQKQYSFRVVGLTGTPYRGKAESIVGEHAFFKEEVCSISTSWLIFKNFLTKPVFVNTANNIDFSALRVNNMGRFNNNELQSVIDKNERLTGKIMREIAQLDCKGVFVFASTRKHCEECARSLPDGTWAIITGETKHEERRKIMGLARNGDLRFLISVNCLNVGVDVPLFDVCAWLRPTESLVLFTQGIGRVLRLHPGKTHAKILDYAGNLDRFSDMDHPIINEALKIRDNHEEEEKPFFCYKCQTPASIHTRRCHGMVHNARCDHFFQFKDCTRCHLPNDITARHCRSCEHELINPNTKLKLISKSKQTLNVIKATYEISMFGTSPAPIIKIAYFCNNNMVIYENYLTNTDRARQITYNKFIKLHCQTPSKWYRLMMHRDYMQLMIEDKNIKTPIQLICTQDNYNRLTINKKIFNDDA